MSTIEGLGKGQGQLSGRSNTYTSSGVIEGHRGGYGHGRVDGGRK